ncbi:hypothetical protein EVAR_36538_1 [Eumeta japonica]|uniref:Pre-C2HC domain-containing protein n=1 Tax=Eumeta variegata TaxID=151549 RepID=A0A4C1Z876_EUMVA|nr:hypothetical protein EVAR_36538_1 [Eumeta japonica]
MAATAPVRLRPGYHRVSSKTPHQNRQVKSTNHSDSSITSKKVNSVNSTKTVASNKEATTSSVTLVKTTNVTGSKPSPPPRVKPPPPICLRDKSKWNHIASECSRLHINYNKAQNTRNGINITMSSIDDFRKLNSYLIKSDIPFHTYALEEERKVKAVLKGVPVEIDTEDIKADLVRQEYPVQAVHRMHRRDGTALGLVLAILNKTDGATDIFKKLANVCGLSGITVEAPYKKGIPGQCHRCQLYGHAATNCHAPPRGNKQTARTVPTKPTGSKNFHPAPAPKENQWKNPLPWTDRVLQRRNSTVLQTDAQLQSDRYPSPNKSRSHRLQINNVNHGAIIIISVYLPPKRSCSEATSKPSSPWGMPSSSLAI